MKQLSKEFFGRNAVILARDLLGKIIEINGMQGRVVETEAYCSDKASHAFVRTDRSSLMFDTYGHVYVYMTYGMHHCLNITTDSENAGAVLIRAIEPLTNLTVMKIHRKSDFTHNLCNGPGKLCQAFNVGMDLNGQLLGDGVKVYDDEYMLPKIVQTTRVGIKDDVELPWRFYLAESHFVSQK